MTMDTRRAWLAAALLALLGTAAAAPADDKDHPMLSRMPGFVVMEKEAKAFDAVRIEDFEVQGKVGGRSQALSFEGRTTRIKYLDEQERTSPVAILRNYANAIRSLGGSQLNAGYGASAGDIQGGYHVFRVPQTGGEPVHVLLYINSPQWYTLTIVEPKAMVQQVSAQQLAGELQASGFATVRLNFATGSAELPSDAAGTIKAIVQLLKDQPSLKLSVNGHTDNVGQAADNKKLSQARAESVRKALVAQGVAEPRLKAAGFGAEQPVADNRTEAGRASNRRVELVRF